VQFASTQAPQLPTRPSSGRAGKMGGSGAASLTPDASLVSGRNS
jgi:hypothetical protein